MRTRTIFGILLVLVALVAFGPALIAVGSQQVAEAFGCQVDLNRVIPCVIGGKDYGQTFYDLGFLIWYSYLSLPAGLALLGVWAAGRAHRDSCELAQAESTAVRATQPGQILSPRRAHCHCARIFSDRRHLYRRPHRLAYRMRS